MKLIDYIKSSLPAITCQLVIFLVIDAVLFSSSTIGKSAADILYLNILMGVVCLGFFIFGFSRARARYDKVRKALDENGGIDYLVPVDDSFYSAILRDTVQLKNSEQQQAVNSYKRDVDELKNYITKWVHEIKIPISVSELLLEDTNTIDIETSRKFKAEIERIKFLVNQVLYAGRAAHYQEDLSANEFNLQKAVKEAIKINSYFLMSKNIEVIPKALDFDIVTDEKWVIYILEQILNNASKYTRQDGRVEIYAKDDDKAVYLHIKDNGIGIPSSDMARIFDGGFTGENGRKASKSTGMGLYYSKKIADRLGVGIIVASTVGEFTEFVLTFNKLNDYLNVTKI